MTDKEIRKLKSWLQIAQSSAVVSTLLAGIAATLLSFVKADDNYKAVATSPAKRSLVVGLCYAALLLNIYASMMAYAIVEKTSNGRSPSHKLKFAWIVCFLGGVYTLIAMTLTYIWIQEPVGSRVLLTMLGACSVIPPILLMD